MRDSSLRHSLDRYVNQGTVNVVIVVLERIVDGLDEVVHAGKVIHRGDGAARLYGL